VLPYIQITQTCITAPHPSPTEYNGMKITVQHTLANGNAFIMINN